MTFPPSNSNRRRFLIVVGSVVAACAVAIAVGFAFRTWSRDTEGGAGFRPPPAPRGGAFTPRALPGTSPTPALAPARPPADAPADAPGAAPAGGGGAVPRP